MANAKPSGIGKQVLQTTLVIPNGMTRVVFIVNLEKDT